MAVPVLSLLTQQEKDVRALEIAAGVRSKLAHQRFYVAGHSIGAGGGSSDEDTDQTTRFSSSVAGGLEDNWALSGAILHRHDTEPAANNGGFARVINSYPHRDLQGAKVGAAGIAQFASVCPITPAVPSKWIAGKTVVSIGTGANAEQVLVKTIDSTTQVTFATRVDVAHAANEPVFETPNWSYTPRCTLNEFYYGVNDYAMAGRYDFPRKFIEPLRAISEFGRLGAFYPAEHTSVTPTGFAQTNETAGLRTSRNGIVQRGSAVGNKVNIVCPADYPGTGIVLFFASDSGAGALLDTTVDGAAGPQIETRTLPAGQTAQLHDVIALKRNLVCKRLTAAAGRHTVEATINSVTGGGAVDFIGWGILAEEPPITTYIGINQVTGDRWAYYSPTTFGTATWLGSQARALLTQNTDPVRAVPDADDATGSWTNTPLWSKIEEWPFSDADVITSNQVTHVASPLDTSVARVRLADVADPGVDTGLFIRLRARRVGTGGGTATISLKEGTTTRAVWTTAALTTSLTDYAVQIGTTDADDITDFNNLFLEFKGTTTTAGTFQLEIAGLTLELPPAPGTASTGITQITVAQAFLGYPLVGGAATVQRPIKNVELIIDATDATNREERAVGTVTASGSDFVITLDTALAKSHPAGALVIIGMNNLGVTRINTMMSDLAAEDTTGRTALVDADAATENGLGSYFLLEGLNQSAAGIVHLNDRAQSNITAEMIKVIEEMDYPPEAAAHASFPSAPLPCRVLLFGHPTGIALANVNPGASPAEAEYLAALRVRLDLRRARWIRISGYLTVAQSVVTNGAAIIRAKYCPDIATLTPAASAFKNFYQRGDWTRPTGGQGDLTDFALSSGIGTFKFSSWCLVPPEARLKDCHLTLFCKGGGSAGTAPSVSHLAYDLL